jgi:glycosyltransferase involved in cell wall biosynthesis
LKVIFFLKYGSQAASTRYRFLQFSKALQENEIEYEFSSLLDNSYLIERLKTKKLRVVPLLQGYCKRMVALLFVKKYDLVVIHCELFPYLPGLFEAWIRWNGIPYILDYDDAIFHQYDNHKNILFRWAFKSKIKRIIRGAKAVWAANEYLAQYARAVNKNVQIFPTVIDMDRYVEKSFISKSFSKEDPFIIGWIGSPSTAELICEILDSLAKFCEKYPAKLILVGSGNMNITSLPVEIVEWSESAEISELHRFDVGIMPLRENAAWDKGKSAFKLIQYMGCGLPVVGSRIGTNMDVISDGADGYLALSGAEWIKALEAIYSRQNDARRMGAAGRLKIQKFYSLQALSQRWINSLFDSEK